ncbi:cation:proton antiporter [Clostridium celatum]|uniref:cation:proton antiporter n=1 Tax=Clostridium celatum TaxID=36834 RepID=UPI00164D4849|nr:cation:proton antiporter [Clostridium celatum]MCE9655573.1 cation:proton antiporter [Clostridium celatum]MDU2265960.1 cation:proton antiporter [Clostridium celatum]MDU6296202.1 cation:proton antiporter [Clostridium celatum]
MMSYRYLLDIALILLSTKFLGLLTRRFNLPQVVGALLAGVILGPSVLNILHETDFIGMMAELGVIVIMFTAGLESDIRQLKNSGKDSLIIATFGVIIPLIGGTIVAYIFNDGSLSTVSNILQNVFIGAILTATSVSITVEALRELGKLSEKSATVILGAAIIDDILGIIVLTIITSISDKSVNVGIVFLKIIAFFIFALVVGYIIYIVFDKWINKYDIDKRRFVIGAFVVCLLLSFCAEEFFGVADITGAFIAGLVLSRNRETEYISKRFDIISYMLLSPIFFASIGINMEIPKMTVSIIIMTIVLVAVAMLSKIIGCGLGAKICGYSKKEIIQIGTGMMARGEVALVIANKGIKLGIMNTYFLPSIIIMIITAAICTPILLKKAYTV